MSESVKAQIIDLMAALKESIERPCRCGHPWNRHYVDRGHPGPCIDCECGDFAEPEIAAAWERVSNAAWICAGEEGFHLLVDDDIALIDAIVRARTTPPAETPMTRDEVRAKLERAMSIRERLQEIVKTAVALGRHLPEWQEAMLDDRPQTVEEAVTYFMDTNKAVLALLAEGEPVAWAIENEDRSLNCAHVHESNAFRDAQEIAQHYNVDPSVVPLYRRPPVTEGEPVAWIHKDHLPDFTEKTRRRASEAPAHYVALYAPPTRHRRAGMTFDARQLRGVPSEDVREATAESDLVRAVLFRAVEAQGEPEFSDDLNGPGVWWCKACGASVPAGDEVGHRAALDVPMEHDDTCWLVDARDLLTNWPPPTPPEGQEP